MSFSGQIFPEDTVGYFRIPSDTGRNPIVPFSVGEFRIGSGAECHLRFGDPTIPLVHTTLCVESDTVTLKSSVSNPGIVVNGTPTTECQLHDGDLVELGEHRLLFRLATAQDRITLDEDAFIATGPAAESEDGLEQLVDRLGQQIDIIDEMAHTPDVGVAELIKTVANLGQNKDVSDSAPASAPSEELNRVTQLMQKHHEASRIRLESLTSVLDNVVQQQKLIADTLEVMSERIQAMNHDKDSGFPPRRASA